MNKWHNKYGARTVKPYPMKKMAHTHRHQHDDQHIHEHENNKKEHSHEHEHDAIIYGDERGYTIIEEKEQTDKLKDLDMDDLKQWREDENIVSAS